MPIFARRSDDIRLPRPRLWIVLVLALLLTACAAAPAPPPSQTYLGAKTVIFVTSNGWHSGIVVAKADLPPDRLPETMDFPAADFLEFGWGDAVYYPAKQPTFGMSLQAALVRDTGAVEILPVVVDDPRDVAEHALGEVGHGLQQRAFTELGVSDE